MRIRLAVLLLMALWLAAVLTAQPVAAEGNVITPKLDPQIRAKVTDYYDHR